MDKTCPCRKVTAAADGVVVVTAEKKAPMASVVAACEEGGIEPQVFTRAHVTECHKYIVSTVSTCAPRSLPVSHSLCRYRISKYC